MKKVITVLLFSISPVCQFLSYIFYFFRIDKIKIFNIPLFIPVFKSFIQESNYYCHSFALRSFFRSNNLRFYNSFIEHGLILSEIVQVPKLFNNTIYTFSDFRKKIILEINPNLNVVTLGSYILNISDRFYSKRSYFKFTNKYILVFLPHSTKENKQSFNSEILMNFYNRIKTDTNLDLVIVVYYKDFLINKGLIKNLKNNNYKIVTCGHKFDPNYLFRLKFLIQNSVFCISNSVGTQLGYTIQLNKAHFIVDNLFHENNNYNSIIKDILICFNKNIFDNSFITNEQSKIVNKYWGEGYEI